MSFFFEDRGRNIDIMQEIFDKTKEVLKSLELANKLREKNRSLIGILDLIEKDQKKIEELIAKVNPEIIKIINDPKNSHRKKFNIIDEYCRKKEQEHFKK